jgi:hypothetical protein
MARNTRRFVDSEGKFLPLVIRMMHSFVVANIFDASLGHILGFVQQKGSPFLSMAHCIMGFAARFDRYQG